MKKDEIIIKEIFDGDIDLFSIIIDRYQEKLIRYVNFMVKNHDSSIDIVQETFIKAYTNLKGFDSSKKFSSWIYKIAYNQTLNFIKKHKKQVYIKDEDDFASEEDIESDFDKKEEYKNLERCIDKLDIKYSGPLVLFYFEKKSYSEISDILRMPEGTVATRINRAKKIIKKICQIK